MLKHENYTSEHIAALKVSTGADPSILERTIYAFGLLEAIRRIELPFVFKGGTSLLVLLENPRRLSTDIDIIVEPGTDIDGFIQKAGMIFPFLSVEENFRKGNNKIEKRHFRFQFLSPRSSREISVLLDVVFEENPYIRLISKPIRNNILLSEKEDLYVSVPDKNCILGDKLSAFAPHTTGIPFGVNKELEIIKQMYDCWVLIQEMDDYSVVSNVYNKVAQMEAGYRGLEIQPKDSLLDTIESCLCIMGRGGIRPDEYQYFLAGINAIQGHVFNGRINGENAGMMACEIMYLAACIMTGQSAFERVTSPASYQNEVLSVQGMKKIGYIRKTDPAAYSYLVKAMHLLQQDGLYTESILTPRQLT